jgi:hypothetical protein
MVEAEKISSLHIYCANSLILVVPVLVWRTKYTNLRVKLRFYTKLLFSLPARAVESVTDPTARALVVPITFRIDIS